MSNYESQSQEDYRKNVNVPLRKQCQVVNLENSLFPQSLNYRFEWIPEKPQNKKSQPLNTRDSVRNIKLPLGHYLTSGHNSFIDSKIVRSNKANKNNNSPVTTMQSRKITDNLSQQNKSYTVVDIKFEKLLQKKGLNTLIEYKKINILDQPSPDKNVMKNKHLNLKSKITKKSKPMESSTTTECIEPEGIKENTSVTQTDLKYETDLSENDNEFEITVINNQQLETKTIII